MSEAFVVLCALAALAITLARGAGTAFAWVYLPALLFFSMVTPLHLAGIPDPAPPSAAIYGILIGSLVAGRRAQLRPAAIDFVIVGLLIAYVISTVTTSNLYTAVNTLGTTGLEIVAPYFIVRTTFERPVVQRQAITVFVGSILVILFFAVLELRLWPDTYADLLVAVGLDDPGPRFAMRRFGFFRARSSFFHPIDLGNTAVLICATIAMLSWRSTRGIRRLWITWGLGATSAALLTTLSFTSYLGAAAAASLYFALRRIRLAQRLLAPIVLVLILAGFGMTWRLANTPLGERPPESAEALVKSYWIRQLIVHRSIDASLSAGPWGWGYRLWEVYRLDSADNAYLLITMQRGWVALGLWLALPLCLAQLAARGLRRARSPTERRAILAGFSSVIGIMVAMYTVFYGFVYANLLMVTTAMTVNAAQAQGPLRRRARRAPARAGAPALPGEAAAIR